MITKVLNKFRETISQVDFYMPYLEMLDFKAFEENLSSLTKDLYKDIAMVLMTNFCQSKLYAEKVNAYCKDKGVIRVKKRGVELRLCTGDSIKLPSFYADKVKSAFKGERHILHGLFGNIGNSSRSLISKVAKTAVAVPSFDLAEDVLNEMGIDVKTSYIRSSSIKLGNVCLPDRVKLQLQESENLIDKSVIVSIDGGRTRTRIYKEEKNKKGSHKLFETPWREPKLLVIHVLDPLTGKQSKKEYPIYDCTFSDEECFKLTEEYLRQLQVERAKHVQFVADGAHWIWKRAKPMLLKLGVKEANITETLDYYHAVEHLGVLVKNLPKRIMAKGVENIYRELKEMLWNGKISDIIKYIRTLTKSNNKILIREINYFQKNELRCNYAKFRERKLLCGSGIVESGVRRVINLRFKCPSSFWKEENLEPLIYLRAVHLAKRWNIMFSNLA